MSMVTVMPEGKLISHDSAFNKPPTLQELYGIIGCDLIEIVYFQNAEGDEGQMIIDERGRLQSNTQINHFATGMYRHTMRSKGNSVIYQEELDWYSIYGRVVLLTNEHMLD